MLEPLATAQMPRRYRGLASLQTPGIPLTVVK